MGIRVNLNNVTVAFPHLFKLHAAPGTTNEKYSIECVWESSRQDIVDLLEKAFMSAAAAAGKGAVAQGMARTWKSGDMENERRATKGKDPRGELAGKFFIRANETSRPHVVDGGMNHIMEDQADQIFGGCICNVAVDLYYSGNPVNPGVYCGLKGVQLVSNTNVERFGGTRTSAEDLFNPVADEVPSWM